MKHPLTISLCLVILASGCTTASQTTGPNGRAAHNISCNGSANNIGNCYAKATELCGSGGFNVVDRETSTAVWDRDTTLQKRSLLVQCKGS